MTHDTPADYSERDNASIRDSGLDTILWVSLLMMLICSDKSWWLAAIPASAAIATWCRPNLIHDWRMWMVIGILQAIRNTVVWIHLDDHIAVANYWSFVIALALSSTSTRNVVTVNARWIIALVFVFATGWKLGSAEYTNGAFFEYTLLLDDRFLPLARWIGGVPTEGLIENYRNMSQLRNGQMPELAFMVRTTVQAHALAQFLTWWTVLIEGTVALAFLAACLGGLSPVRNGLLALFAATTYVPVPVTGFCAVLMVLGFAQCGPSERISRRMYAGVFFAAILWTPVWQLLN